MNPLLKKYGQQKRWVTYQLQTRGGKVTKVPYTPKGDLASSTNEIDWSTADEVLKHHKALGIVFTPDKLLLGIDIDKCIDNGKVSAEIQAIIDKANSYTEISPSGTGLHIFLELDESMDLLSNRKNHFEVYVEGRYFTVTQNPFGDVKEVRTITVEEANEILALTGYPWGKKNENNEPIVYRETPLLDDSDLLQKMFNSKNGEKIKTLYEGHGNSDTSVADAALLSHLAFWTGKDALQMERIWISSPLGNRKKTRGVKQYRDRTINFAISGCREVYENQTLQIKSKLQAEAPTLDLVTVKDIIVQNTENISRVLTHHPEFNNRLRYDIFKNIYEIKPQKINKWRPLEDNDAVIIQTAISVVFPCFSKIGKEMVYDAIIKVAKDNEIDSAADYIRSITWDKVGRIDTWLSTVYGCEDNKYHREVGSKWMKALVKRIIEPGCQFDHVLVLEGEQGAKKSSSLRALGGGWSGWHVETTMSVDNKDFFMQFQGKAIIEFSEGETLNRTEVAKMKGIITNTSDKYRPPYERASKEFPRRCVFAMTTNRSEYLKDDTGNRRWLPVTVIFPQANVEWINENRDQLFAEAYYRLSILKEYIHDFSLEEMTVEQNARRIMDPNAELVANWYVNDITELQRKEGVTVHQAYRDAINGGFSSKPLEKYQEMMIADVFRNVLKLTKKRTLKDGLQANRWYDEKTKVEESPPMITDDEMMADAVNKF